MKQGLFLSFLMLQGLVFAGPGFSEAAERGPCFKIDLKTGRKISDTVECTPLFSGVRLNVQLISPVGGFSKGDLEKVVALDFKPYLSADSSAWMKLDEKLDHWVSSVYPIEKLDRGSSFKIDLLIDPVAPASFNRAFTFADAKSQSVVYLGAYLLEERFLYPVLAHETHHAIQNILNPDEEVWLDEGIAYFIEMISGGDVSQAIQELKTGLLPPLMNWTDIKNTRFSPSFEESRGLLRQYGLSMSFVGWLYQKFGKTRFLTALLNENQSIGMKRVQKSLASLGVTQLSIQDLFAEFYLELFKSGKLYVEKNSEGSQIFTLRPNQSLFLQVPPHSKYFSFKSAVSKVDFLLLERKPNSPWEIRTENHIGFQSGGYLFPINSTEKVLYLQNTGKIDYSVEIDLR